MQVSGRSMLVGSPIESLFAWELTSCMIADLYPSPVVCWYHYLTPGNHLTETPRSLVQTWALFNHAGRSSTPLSSDNTKTDTHNYRVPPNVKVSYFRTYRPQPWPCSPSSKSTMPSNPGPGLPTTSTLSMPVLWTAVFATGPSSLANASSSLPIS